MPITALSSDAVRAIGSSQVLSDPASMVKELLDNAIDGRATRISIELSTNILDDIRVKDNGHGIAPDDRAMICTRHCTSKIRDLHDLEVVGGRSLGFRGEALASAAEMTGKLTVTTRIEGEETAAELTFDHGGQISSQKRTSHPVGTTVRVENFLRHLPVRRQAAEKISVKMLAKVRKMLQSYALTRPHLRLSLKILKAKDRKGDWTYPKGGALSASRVEASFNAATDIFGKKLTSECESTVSTWSSAGEQIDEIMSQHSGSSASRDEAYTLEAIIPKQDCDGSALSNIGQFVSVDSRPVSCVRGTLKQIISSYKSLLRSTIDSGGNAKIVDPFLCLNIRCPPASYDANVEPAKDDVLFTSAELVLEITQRWFNSVYGEVKPTSLNSSGKTASADKPRGIELLFAQKKAPVESARKDRSPMIASTFPEPVSASNSTSQNQPFSKPLLAPDSHSPAIAPLRSQNGDEVSGTLSHSATRDLATDLLQTESFPDDLPNHDVSTIISTKGPSNKLSSYANFSEKPIWQGSMYGEEDDEEDPQSYPQGSPHSPVDLDGDGDEHLRDVNASNPWSFAKLNAAMRPSARNKQLHTPARQSGDAGSSTDPPSDDLPGRDGRSMPKRRSSRIHQSRSSPEVAYPTPSPFPFPQKARGKRKVGDTGVDTSSTPAPSNVERSTRGALDTWVQRSLDHYDQPDDSHTNIQDERGPPHSPYCRDFVPARSLLSDGTPLSEIPDSSRNPRRKPAARRQQQGNIDKPFVSPVNDPNRVWFDTEEDPSQRRPPKHRRNRDVQDSSAAATLSLRNDDIEDADSVPPSSVRPSLPSTHTELAKTLDYEARKQKASETYRRILRDQAASANLSRTAPSDRPDPLHPQHVTSSPHKNRQAKAIAALHTSAPPSPQKLLPLPAEDQTATLEASDPRAYLLRIHRQEEQAPERAGKSRRRKTALLPLETISDESYTGDLTLVVEDVNAGDVEEDMRDSGAWDRYVRVGEVGGAFEDVDAERVRTWEGMLKGLVGRMYAVGGEEGEQEQEQEGADMDVDLVKVLRAHADGYA